MGIHKVLAMEYFVICNKRIQVGDGKQEINLAWPKVQNPRHCDYYCVYWGTARCHMQQVIIPRGGAQDQLVPSYLAISKHCSYPTS